MPQKRDPLTMTRCTLLMLLVDALRYLGLCLRSPAALAAENLFLRQQFALYRERDVRPRHATHAARLALIWLGRRFDWRNAIAACFGPEAVHCSPAGPKWVAAAWMGSSSSRRPFVCKRFVPTQRPPSIPTWRAKQDARVMMPGAGSRRGALQTRHAERLDRPRSGLRWQVMHRRDEPWGGTAFVQFPRVGLPPH
jgi:hypothetical protein